LRRYSAGKQVDDDDDDVAFKAKQKEVRRCRLITRGWPTGVSASR